MLGERTTRVALRAIDVAAVRLVLAKSPVVSVNGNVAALVPDEIVELAGVVDAGLEVNIFHYSAERLERMAAHLIGCGAEEVLGLEPDSRIPGLDHNRANCCSAGIYGADVVLVPLEDGDRAEALVGMGKTVITIDLNPLSRTAKTCSVTIVDNLVRAIPLLVERVKVFKEKMLAEGFDVLKNFDNQANLDESLRLMTPK